MRIIFAPFAFLICFNSFAQTKQPEDTTKRFNILNEVVVSASRMPETILQSPVSIEKMNYQAIKEMPSLSF
jgi:hypothetical protein